MYNINDIKLQNQQDAWSLLYFHFCTETMRGFGENGERAVRLAVKSMGVMQGRMSREEHAGAGLNTNLNSLFKYGCLSSDDPRTVTGPVRESLGQLRLWDVYVCPVAFFLRSRGASKFGLFFEEEYMRGVIAGYTEGRGQLNLSKTLSCPRDVHSQYSAYLRPANQTPEQRKRSFGSLESVSGISSKPFTQIISDRTVLLTCMMHKTLTDMFPQEGEYVFSRALRGFLPEALSMMVKKADDAQMPCDGEFLKLNFPIDVCSSNTPLWDEADGTRAAELMQKLVLTPLQAGFCSVCKA